MTEFWMVWKDGSTALTYRHESEGSARAEAERLAKANPGKHFFVLKAIAVCVTEKPVRWESLQPADIPF